MNNHLSTRIAVVAALCVVLTGVLAACATSGPEQDRGASQSATGIPFANLVSQARAIHDKVLVLDAHADIVPPGTTSRYGDADGSSQVAPEKMVAGGSMPWCSRLR